MAERKMLSKNMRYRVFKRDNFTCQYCGRSAPEVVLEVDHIVPLSKGGDNTLSNLVTSCRDCNRGKRDDSLKDDSLVMKRKLQEEELSIKREQTEMMVSFEKSVDELMDVQIKAINSYLEKYWSLTARNCKQTFRTVIRAIGFPKTYEYLREAYDSKCVLGEDESKKAAWDYFIDLCTDEANRREENEGENGNQTSG